jgi:hypothetical protein
MCEGRKNPNCIYNNYYRIMNKEKRLKIGSPWLKQDKNMQNHI